ncbi:hypothetical protein [Jeotgalibacillus proteolyticus]|uniref:hypothetical protein n=1 Tax=Jeotgalibacillus proteolyticus TaxID=2082395 RepID=UPI003CE7F07C
MNELGKRIGKGICWALTAFVLAYILSAALNSTAPQASNWVVYPLVILATVGIVEVITMFFTSQKREAVN